MLFSPHGVEETGPSQCNTVWFLDNSGKTYIRLSDVHLLVGDSVESDRYK